MKKLFSLALLTLMMVASNSFAQSSVLATLSHDGQISTFYGAGALKSAHAAAAHGDVITLSSGSFLAVNITKAVTIRGAGMQTDSVARIYPSVIEGDFYIEVADSLEQRLTVEGVNCGYEVTVYDTLSNATFIKSRFDQFVASNSTTEPGIMKNLTFIHCKISDYFYNQNSGNTVSFVNSVVMNPRVGKSSYANNSFEFTNCVVMWYSSSPDDNSFYAIYRNCILSTLYNNTYSVLSSTNLIYNCLGVASSNMFKNHGSLASNLYYTTTELTDVFMTWTGGYSSAENFELKDTAKAKYLGDDGKEVGIYGGNLPYTPNPTNPKITKFNVASKSTADGKLSVDIEVKAAE